jgi:hypothetical protein
VKKEPLNEIPAKMSSFWLPEHHAVLDEWASYFVSLEEFKTAVMVKGVKASTMRRGRAWIVDSRNAKGVFSDEIQAYIGTNVFKEFMAHGVKFFITIRSKVSSATNLTIVRYEKQAGPAGIQLVTVDTLEQALAFLHEVDTGKVAA